MRGRNFLAGALLTIFMIFVFAGTPAHAQDVDAFTNDGGSCGTHQVTKNGHAATNWTCNSSVRSGDVPYFTVSFSVVLNGDGTFDHGYLAFYDSKGQVALISNTWAGTFDGVTFTGAFDGTDPAGNPFTGNATQSLAARKARYVTLYSVAPGSNGSLNLAN